MSLKVARRLAGVIAVPLIAHTGWKHRSQLKSGLSLLPHLSPGWVVIGAVAETASLLMFALLQRGLLGEARHLVSRRNALMLIMAGNAMTNSLPGGPAWSSTWYWAQLRQRRVSGPRAAWSIVGSGFFSGISLALVIAAGAELAGSHGPLATLRYVGVVVASVALSLLAALALIPERFKQRWSRTLKTPWMRAWSEYSLDIQGWRVFAPFGQSLANWALDLLLLAACLRAVQPHVSWSGLVAAYGLTQLAAVFPITPGGIAVVEGTLVALLTAYGTPAGPAVAAVVLYRAVSFWGVTPAGWIAYAALSARSSTGKKCARNRLLCPGHSTLSVQRVREA